MEVLIDTGARLLSGLRLVFETGARLFFKTQNYPTLHAKNAWQLEEVLRMSAFGRCFRNLKSHVVPDRC